MVNDPNTTPSTSNGSGKANGRSKPRVAVSIRDLAQQVGVSTATVSRALNNQPEVSPDTRAKVLALADQAGYQFRVGKRFTNVIGLVYPNHPVHPDEGSFESAMISGILKGVDDHRYDLQFINVERDKGNQESFSQLFRRKGLRGVIVRSIRSSPDLAELIAAERFPHVLIADRSEDPHVNYIESDSRPESAEAVDHLAQLGPTRIAHDSNSIEDSDHRDRYQGFRDGLTRNGLEFDPALRLALPGTFQGGAAALDRLLSLDNPPTAIYITTPPATVGVLQRCLQLGINVPNALSIIGFDDSQTRRFSFPHFTAVCQDATKLGLEASRWLTRHLEGLAPGPLRERRGTSFDIGHSTTIPPRTPARLPTNNRFAPMVQIPGTPADAMTTPAHPVTETVAD